MRIYMNIYELVYNIAKRKVRFTAKRQAVDSDFLTPCSGRSRIANLKNLI